jgi:hypothetical protein
VDVIIERVQEIGVEVQSLSVTHKAFIEGDWVELVLDGVTKAQQARARERVKRLGRILAYAYVRGERKPPELTEELLRVAAGLDEDDVAVLAWLCDGLTDKYKRLPDKWTSRTRTTSGVKQTTKGVQARGVNRLSLLI